MKGVVCMHDDKGNIDAARAALDGDSRLAHAAEIAVASRGGTLTVRGTVRSVHQRRVAVEIAKAVPGVGDVVDELRVDPRDRFLDGEARGAALQALMSNDGVPEDMIDVHVANGWLTLKGEVKHQSESDAAFAAVSGLAGVGGITNEIKVVTAGIGG
jgi:osmotically-inducible protein OsmY